LEGWVMDVGAVKSFWNCVSRETSLKCCPLQGFLFYATTLQVYGLNLISGKTTVTMIMSRVIVTVVFCYILIMEYFRSSIPYFCEHMALRSKRSVTPP